MPKNKPLPAPFQDTSDLIEATFYEALQNADLDKLMACWADEDDIVCVHPGGARLVGALAIRASFEALFANGAISARPEQLRKMETLGSAVHHLVERVDVLTPEGPRHAWVIATNVYHKTVQGWRLVTHHASPGTLGSAHEIHEGASASQVLH